MRTAHPSSNPQTNPHVVADTDAPAVAKFRVRPHADGWEAFNYLFSQDLGFGVVLPCVTIPRGVFRCVPRQARVGPRRAKRSPMLFRGGAGT